MYIETVPNGGSPPAILLRESYRDGGRIRKRTLLNLSHWPAEHVEGLRGVLKGGVALPPGEQPFAVERSLPHGAVAAVSGRDARHRPRHDRSDRRSARVRARELSAASTSSWP